MNLLKDRVSSSRGASGGVGNGDTGKAADGEQGKESNDHSRVGFVFRVCFGFLFVCLVSVFVNTEVF